MATNMSNILLEAGTNEVEILELYIDEEGYQGFFGVNVAKVLEIIPLPKKIIRPPSTQGTCAVGMFNHREKIIALIDLAAWLGKKRTENQPPKVIITEFNNVVTAFMVSGVTRIHRLTWGDIKPLDEYVEDLSDSITGVIHLEDKIVFLLDLEKALSDLNPELAIKDTPENIAGNKLENLSQPIKVLHADDSSIIRTTVRHRLEENSFTVKSVVSGDEAWTYLVDLKTKAHEDGVKITDFVEVILTDIEMPGVDGYHLCKRIKEDQELRTIPVILFSSLITDKLLHKGESVGADGQFAKPDMALMGTMRKLVEEKRQAA